ncbi:DUF1674 domain-containing protein [Notoacmeibacter sp. MSK16QG-6]|uniref:DUF1674 domain-containing protein n=1 Tax=Notoacmeibacter sp. MSK16QG-6 TaxID=2957982 RepID=UPI00209D7E3C|nr:DUF1674 domain-containing protein [Notoacmeibacter sp. MSK16QG-6]MCP1199284.1 DUF1674 domain-containing protein [Notoacmeibacter sp. MSK16QG-6]
MTETGQSNEKDARLTENASQARRFEDLPPAAQRALQEAQKRRQAFDAFEDSMPREIDGRGGREPVRYGDWEKKGIAVDF